MIGREITIKDVMTRKKISLTNELIRKAIHMLVGFVPFFAKQNLLLTVSVVAFGLFFYGFNEYFRHRGKRNFLPVSRITEMASRERDQGHFVLGPLTLALGVLLALLFFPHPASTLAIYALAFGDGLASLIGKVWGRTLIPFLKGKTFEGSLACFAAVYMSSFAVLNHVGRAFLIALFSTLLEAVPLKDYDNIIIPVGTGVFSLFLLGLI